MQKRQNKAKKSPKKKKKTKQKKKNDAKSTNSQQSQVVASFDAPPMKTRSPTKRQPKKSDDAVNESAGEGYLDTGEGYLDIVDPLSADHKNFDHAAIQRKVTKRNPLFEAEADDQQQDDLVVDDGEEEFGFSVEETFDGFGEKVPVMSVPEIPETELNGDDEEFGFDPLPPSNVPALTRQNRSTTSLFGEMFNFSRPASSGLEDMILNADPFAMSASNRQAWLFSPSFINEWFLTEMAHKDPEGFDFEFAKDTLIQALQSFVSMDKKKKWELDVEEVAAALSDRGYMFEEVKEMMVNVDDDNSGTLRYREFANLLLIQEGVLVEPLVDDTEPIVTRTGEIVTFNDDFGTVKQLKRFHKLSPGAFRKEPLGHLLITTDTQRKDKNTNKFTIRIEEGAHLLSPTTSVSIALNTGQDIPKSGIMKTKEVHKTENPSYNAEYSWVLHSQYLEHGKFHITVQTHNGGQVLGMITISAKDIASDDINTNGWMMLLDPKTIGNRWFFNSKRVVPSKVYLMKQISLSQKSRRRSLELQRYKELTPPNDPNELDFLKMLGQGSFGKVFLAKDRTSGQRFAVKAVSKALVEEHESVELVMVERKVLSLPVRCPFVPHLFSCFQSTSFLFFVMEVIEGGNLAKILKTRRRFSEKDTTFYTAEILNGLWFLHHSGVLYRDLKLDNVLLDSRGHVKLADFGLAKDGLKHGERTNTLCGTPSYLAPELLNQQSYGVSVDFWALGVVTYQLLVGHKPFRISSNNISTSGGDDDDENLTEEQQDELFNVILSSDINIPSTLSPGAQQFLKGLLERDPEQRLGCHARRGEEDVKRSQFLHKISWDKAIQLKLRPPVIPPVDKAAIKAATRAGRRSVSPASDAGSSASSDENYLDLHKELSALTKQATNDEINQASFVGFDWQQEDDLNRTMLGLLI